MPMLRITVKNGEPRLHGDADQVRPALNRQLAVNPGPVTLMVHGYKYLPGHPVHCPHASLLSHAPQPGDWRIVSWPGQLGLTGRPGAGLGISLGWPARGTIWAAHRRAVEAGHGLAALVAEIKRIDPGRPVNVIAHSLGARVTLAAIRAGIPGAIGRAVLLAAAEYGETARAALDSPGGADTEVLNVTTRENDLYDVLLEWLIAPECRGDRMLGHGRLRHPRMVTLQLDHPRSLAALGRAGFSVAPPDRLICHWSPYLREGVFPLYRAVLDGRLPLAQLRALLPTEGSPRWSRLRPRLPRPPVPLLPAE